MIFRRIMRGGFRSLRRVALLMAVCALACAGQDEELVIPVAPACPDSGCGMAGGGTGGGGAGGSAGSAGGGAAGTSGSGGFVSDAGCSPGSSTAASLAVSNIGGVATYQILWVGYTCTEVPYGTIAPGATYTGQTFVGHVWRVRSVPSGTLVKEIVIQPGANQVSVP